MWPNHPVDWESLFFIIELFYSISIAIVGSNGASRPCNGNISIIISKPRHCVSTHERMMLVITGMKEDSKMFSIARKHYKALKKFLFSMNAEQKTVKYAQDEKAALGYFSVA